MKVEGWESKLLASIVKHSSGGFEWGKTDCAIFAWSVRNDILGKTDPPPWGTRYKTEKGAWKAVKRLGCDSIAEAVTKMTEARLVDVSLAQRGDVMAFESGYDSGMTEALGICLGAESVVFSNGGLIRVRTYDAKYCWRTE